MGKIEDAVATMKANLEKNTGKSFDTWVAMARKKNFARHGEVVAWLKAEHALGHGYAVTRVDLGINLKGEPVTARLEASGGFNAMVSHRVRLASPGDVDAELKRRLKKAYDAA